MTIAAGLPIGPEDAEWRAIWRAVLAAGFELDQRRDVQGIYHRQVGLYADLLTAGADAGVFTLTGVATDIAMSLMAMEDYFGYRIVARDPGLTRDLRRCGSCASTPSWRPERSYPRRSSHRPHRLHGGAAAVDMQYRAGDEARAWRGQEHHGRPPPTCPGARIV